MSGPLWRWVDRHLARSLPPFQHRTTLGDLMEDHARRRKRHGRVLAAFWLVRECWDVSRVYRTGQYPDSPQRFPMSLSRIALTLSTDLTLAWRTLRRSPGFVVASVATLALAIGVCTAVYSALAGLVLRPLPVPDSGRYVTLWQTTRDLADSSRGRPSASAIDRWRGMTHLFETIVTYTPVPNQFAGGVPEPEMVNVTELPPDTAQALRVRPEVGRMIGPTDLSGDTGRVALLDYSRWQQWFGGAPDVVGKQITLQDVPYTIIGVMPERFVLPTRLTDVWITPQPRGAIPGPPPMTLARLTPGTTLLDVKTQLESLPETGTDVIRAYTLGEELGKRAHASLFILTGAALLLVVIACVNIASLRISRDAIRFRDVVVLQALGATRAAMVRTALMEGAMIAVMGGTLGMGLAWLGVQAMTALRPVRLAALDRVTLDGNALIMVVTACVFTTLAVGLLPAVALRRANPQAVLGQSGRAVTNTRQRSRWVLTVAEIALSLMLLLGATSLVRAHAQMTAEPAGFNAERLVEFTVQLNMLAIPREERPTRIPLMLDAVFRAVSELSGVEAVTRSTSVAPAVLAFPSSQALEPAGDGDVPLTASGSIATPVVMPNYFSVMGVPLLAGRLFEPGDFDASNPAAIVSASLAHALAADGNVLGRRLAQAPNSKLPSPVIIGVVGDVRNHSFGEHALPPWQIYRGVDPSRAAGSAYLVRTSGDSATMIPAIRRAIRDAVPDASIPQLETAEAMLSNGHSQARFNAVLLSTFTTSGLVLTLVGIFGVMALFVGERRRELGVRMALGASRRDVAWVVLARTLSLGVAGTACGLLGAWWLSRYLGTVLDDVPVFDITGTAFAIVGVLCAVCAGAVMPLRRALAVDPADVMRE